MRLLLIIISLLWIGCAIPQAVSDVQDDFVVLRDAQVVKTARTGYEGTLSSETHAFRRILAVSDASRQFERLLEQATPAGEMYALAGLYLTNREHFDEIVTQYQGDQREVEVFVGDVAGTVSVAAVVGYTASDRTPGSIIDGTWPQALAGENEHP